MKQLICEVCKTDFENKKAKRTCSKECSYLLRFETRRTIHRSIEKICVTCSEKFGDTSSKKCVTRCKKCTNEKMVDTRNERGSYIRSVEQNKKLSDTLTKKYENGWNPHTEEVRKKQSDSMKDAWSSGAMKDKSQKKCIEKYGVDHWTKSDEGKKKMSVVNTGRFFSDETRKKMKIASSKRIRDNNNFSSFARGGIREDLGHYVRSGWEANFARTLIFDGKTYEYEPETFALSNGQSYTPDFKVKNVYYEVKGRWFAGAKEKFECFKKDHPEIEVILIDWDVYKDLKTKYKPMISWEGK